MRATILSTGRGPAAVPGRREGGGPEPEGPVARLLAGAGDRLGWAYVHEGPPRPAPGPPGPPGQPDEPPPYDDSWVEGARERARAGMAPFRDVLTVVLGGLGLWAAALVVRAVSGPDAEQAAALVPVALPVGLAIVVLWLSALPQLRVSRRHTRELARHGELVAAHRDEVERARAEQAAEVDRWERAERERQAGDRWVPVGGDEARPVDVFGGTPAGWSALLATFGSRALGRGASVLVLDLTQDEVAGGLLAVASAAGLPAQVVRLPDEIDRVDLLAGLDRDAVVEVLTGALDARRDAGHHSRDDRDVDADLLATAVRCLDDPLSVARIAGAVRVLSGRADDGRLSGAETARLVDEMGHAAAYPRARERLELLRVGLDLLGSADPADPAQARPLSSPGGVAVLETGGNERRKQLLDRLLVQVFAQGLRGAGEGAGRQTVVLAGADLVGLDVLERVAREARRSEVQLVRMFRHLRDGTERLLGTGDARTVLMRLPNAQEAGLAADFLGRSHRFRLSGRTRESSTSRTGTDGWTRTEGDTVSAGQTYPNGWFPRLDAGWTANDGRAFATSSATSWSTATTSASSSSESEQRVYEYEVEPTTLQHLPTTALATVAPGSPTPAFADCDPAIALLPGVAAAPVPAPGDRLALPSPPAAAPDPAAVTGLRREIADR